MSKAKVTVNNACLVCSYGSKKSYFAVSDKHKYRIEKENTANVSDHISMKNIKPFGLCASSANPAVAAALGAPQPCIPVTPVKWQPGNKSFKLDKEKLLDNTCVCRCMWKGIIKVKYPGQESFSVGSTYPAGEDAQAKEAQDKIEKVSEKLVKRYARRTVIASRQTALASNTKLSDEAKARISKKIVKKAIAAPLEENAEKLTKTMEKTPPHCKKCLELKVSYNKHIPADNVLYLQNVNIDFKCDSKYPVVAPVARCVEVISSSEKDKAEKVDLTSNRNHPDNCPLEKKRANIYKRRSVVLESSSPFLNENYSEKAEENHAGDTAPEEMNELPEAQGSYSMPVPCPSPDVFCKKEKLTFNEFLRYFLRQFKPEHYIYTLSTQTCVSEYDILLVKSYPKCYWNLNLFLGYGSIPDADGGAEYSYDSLPKAVLSDELISGIEEDEEEDSSWQLQIKSGIEHNGIKNKIEWDINNFFPGIRKFLRPILGLVVKYCISDELSNFTPPFIHVNGNGGLVGVNNKPALDYNYYLNIKFDPLLKFKKPITFSGTEFVLNIMTHYNYTFVKQLLKDGTELIPGIKNLKKKIKKRFNLVAQVEVTIEGKIEGNLVYDAREGAGTKGEAAVNGKVFVRFKSEASKRGDYWIFETSFGYFYQAEGKAAGKLSGEIKDSVPGVAGQFVFSGISGKHVGYFKLKIKNLLATIFKRRGQNKKKDLVDVKKFFVKKTKTEDRKICFLKPRKWPEERETTSLSDFNGESNPEVDTNESS